MKITLILLTALVAWTATEARAGATAQNAIDVTEQRCMDENGSTAGMIACAEKAYAAWDRELNQQYQGLLKELPAAGRDALRSAQKKWLEYRDQEFRSIDEIYSQLQGTMYFPMRIEARIAVVKQRALSLASYRELLREGK